MTHPHENMKDGDSFGHGRRRKGEQVTILFDVYRLVPRRNLGYFHLVYGELHRESWPHMLLETRTNPLPAALFLLSIVGAIQDWRYKRKGGKRPSKRDRLLFLSAVLLVVGVFVAFWLIGGGSEGATPEIMGYASVPTVIVLFGAWELGRLRVRSKNPLPKTMPEPAASTAPIVPASPVLPRLCSYCGRYSEPSATNCASCGKTFS
jgi:hypothetical protein